MTPAAFSKAADIPAARLDGLIARIQRLLNVDGYEILTLNRNENKIELNVAKLKTAVRPGLTLWTSAENAAGRSSPPCGRGRCRSGAWISSPWVCGRFEPVIAEELADVAQGGAVFKAVRGDYGCGKTFFGRWVQEYAKKKGFATAEVQISETETPLHRLETVYRRAMEQLSTADCFLGAFRSIIDGWFYGLEEDVLAEGNIDPPTTRRRWPSVPTSCWNSGSSRSPVPRRSSPPPCVPTGRLSGRTTTPPPRAWRVGSPGSPTSPHRSNEWPGSRATWTTSPP